jgi:hypothetical protein
VNLALIRLSLLRNRASKLSRPFGFDPGEGCADAQDALRLDRPCPRRGHGRSLRLRPLWRARQDHRTPNLSRGSNHLPKWQAMDLWLLNMGASMSRRTFYASGPFVCFCVSCDAEFMGSVIATHCKECAPIARSRNSSKTHRQDTPSPPEDGQ